ncbi:hypothetical protein MMC30_000716 [Trapelia coarctata]|nr:hypothetical protein [Trapelia coarctata]
MPAQRPSASFEPLPPDLDLNALVESTPNFEYVTRIPSDVIEQQGIESFEKLVLLHVVIGGKPLVIDGFNRQLDQWTFTTQWLRDNVGGKFEQARNLTKKENMPLSINHYLNNLHMLADQWNPYNYKEPNRQRIYLKDIDCPQVWHDKLKEQIPPGVFYLNDSTGDIGGPGSVDEPNQHGLGIRKGKGAARAGDLMSCLPPAMRAENMMCYIGHEGTYTPAHREMCASLGHNIMVEASGTTERDGKPCKPGSSIWFMTETKDRHLVSEYWLSILGHDIEVEAHFAQINAWKAAPFTTYVVEQKVGDFLLIPPLAPHQVWNRGTRTMKAAWNRTTVETLEMALSEALPRARMVCRDEQYKNKAIVLFSLQRYSGLLGQVAMQKQTISDQGALMDLTYSPKIRQLQKDFKRLFALYTQILLSEMPAPTTPPEKRMQYLPYDSFVTCSYCRCNIFNRFLTCTTCVAPLANGEEDTYDICLECYAMGRSCRCLSKLKWVEQFPWKDLVEKHNLWRSQIIDFENGSAENSPKSLDEEKKLLKKKTLAEICQDQLKVRPWQDPKKEIQEVEAVELESDEFNKDGTVKKKKKKRRSEKWLQENVSCHICVHRSPRWKHIICDCGLAFCYGVLWRGFDMMPQTVMENPDWKCPRCLKICSCTACRKDPKNKPFEPTGTILGHDTRKFADPRSIESLVDFSASNMHWVKKAGDDHPHETRRLRRRQDEAEKAKLRDPALNEHYVDDDDQSMPSSGESRMDGNGEQHDPEMPIDPMMLNIDPSLMPPSTSRPRRAQPPAPKTHGNMRAPVANIAGDQSVGAEPIQMAAMEALKAMDNSYQAYPGFGGGMSFQEDNGIIYEYPDPDGPSLSPQTSRYSVQQPPQDFMQLPQDPVHPSQVSLQPPEQPSDGGQKRKRASDRPMIRSDLVELVSGPPSKKPSGARKEPQSVNTDTDEPDTRLVVKLHIDGSKLAGLERKLDEHRAAVGSKDQQTEDSTIIISSDLPTNSNAIADPLSMYKPTKRRLKNDEKDEDFTTRKRDRKSSSGIELKARREKVDYRMLSGSEAEDDEQETYTVNVSKSKRRSLPAYLARRSPVDESELPRELSEIPARRVSRTKQQTSTNSSTSSTTNPSPIEGGHIPLAEAITNGDHASDEVSLPEPRRDPIALVRNRQTVSNIIHKEAPKTKIPAKSTSNPVKVTQQGPSPADDANRQAKLKAVRWAQGDSHDFESSDSDSGHSPIELTPSTRKTFKAKLEAAKQRAAVPAGKEVRKSIFAKPGARKIRITGAKAAANAVKGKYP